MAADFPDLQILGVNSVGHEVGNTGMVDGKDLPWLQDIDDNSDSLSDLWELWDIEERDVIVVDGSLNRVATYNLTHNDLGESENYDELKSIFTQVASANSSTGSISGYSYFDVQDDGVKSAAELPIAEVLVTLTGTTTEGQGVQLTTRTQADGLYQFQGLLPGSYTVAAAQPAMTIDGRETLGNLGGTVANDSMSLDLAAGEMATDYNFGERGRTAATINLNDFLSSTPADGLIVSRDGDESLWYTLTGKWGEYLHAETQFSESPETVEVMTRDSHGHTFRGAFERLISEHVVALGAENDMELMRVSGPLVDITEPQQIDLSVTRDAIPLAEGEAPSAVPAAAVGNWDAAFEDEDDDWRF